jgi:hypothetical protein
VPGATRAFGRPFLSRFPAIDIASGLLSITLLIAGPCALSSSMRSRYVSVSERAVYSPQAVAA